jgi:hypothetical protein
LYRFSRNGLPYPPVTKPINAIPASLGESSSSGVEYKNPSAKEISRRRRTRFQLFMAIYVTTIFKRLNISMRYMSYLPPLSSEYSPIYTNYFRGLLLPSLGFCQE